MQNLEQWCKGKPRILALAARMLVPNIDGIYQLTSLSRGSGSAIPQAVPRKAWLKMTRQSYGSIRRAALVSMNPAAVLELVSTCQAAGDSEKFNILDQQFGSVEELAVLFIPQTFAPREDLLADPQHQFLIQMFDFVNHTLLPCWILYGEMPSRLLRRARQGNWQAICDLLRLDKSLVTDRLLAERWHHAMTVGQPELRRELLSALSGSPRSLPCRRFKLWFAAALSLLADLCGYELQRPELRELFDAVAADRTGAMVDHEMPDGPEAFRQAILRERQSILRLLGFSSDEWQRLIRSLHPKHISAAEL